MDEALEFLAKKPIIIKDLFRLGKYNQASDLPILINLSAVWDRKVVLLRKRTLKHFRLSHLFLSEDLPPELRQRRRASVHSQNGALSSSSYPSGQPNTVESDLGTLHMSLPHQTLTINQIPSSEQHVRSQCSNLLARSRSLSPMSTVAQSKCPTSDPLTCSCSSHLHSSRSSSVESSSSSSTLVQDNTDSA